MDLASGFFRGKSSGFRLPGAGVRVIRFGRRVLGFTLEASTMTNSVPEVPHSWLFMVILPYHTHKTLLND